MFAVCFTRLDYKCLSDQEKPWKQPLRKLEESTQKDAELLLGHEKMK